MSQFYISKYTFTGNTDWHQLCDITIKTQQTFIHTNLIHDMYNTRRWTTEHNLMIYTKMKLQRKRNTAILKQHVNIMKNAQYSNLQMYVCRENIPNWLRDTIKFTIMSLEWLNVILHTLKINFYLNL